MHESNRNKICPTIAYCNGDFLGNYLDTPITRYPLVIIITRTFRVGTSQQTPNNSYIIVGYNFPLNNIIVI